MIVVLTVLLIKKNKMSSINTQIFSQTESFSRRSESWIRFVCLYNKSRFRKCKRHFNVDKLDIDKLKNVPTNLSSLKSKVDQLDADKLVPLPVDLSKLIDVVKIWCFLKRCI